jgi:hypothetical protein
MACKSQLFSGYNSFITVVIYTNINCSLPAGPKCVGEWSKLVCPKFILLFLCANILISYNLSWEFQWVDSSLFQT